MQVHKSNSTNRAQTLRYSVPHGLSRWNHTHESEKMQQGPWTLQPMDIKIYDASTHYGACHKLVSSTNLKVSHQMLVIFGVFWSPLTYPHPMHIEAAGNEVNCLLASQSTGVTYAQIG
jgi:hypothetical protein